MRHLTVKALADRWGVSRSVVYNLVTVGDLPAIRIGTGRGTIRIREDDVHEFEKKKRQDDTKEVLEHFG